MLNPHKKINMTPKQKAHQLFSKYNKEGLQEIINITNRFERKDIIKQCVIICIDEIIDALTHIRTKQLVMGGKSNFYKTNTDSLKLYWEEVRKEIVQI